MTTVGEVRESIQIDCQHWHIGLLLSARRQDSSHWTIWRSDMDQWVPNQGTLETKWVDIPNTTWPNVYVAWNGNDFSMSLENHEFYKDSHVLRYIGHDAREAWECYWEPEKNMFHHTCIRIA